MKPWAIVAPAVIGTLLHWHDCSGQTPAMTAPQLVINNGPLTVSPVTERSSALAFGVQIGNGVVQNPSVWPATFVAQAGGAQCTATLVGPSVILTAAHCVGDGAKLTIQFEDKTTAAGTCNRANGFSAQRPSNDLALCQIFGLANRPGTIIEVVSLDPARVGAGKEIALAGFGCTDLTKKGPVPTVPVLTGGTSIVQYAPGTNPVWPSWLVTQSFVEDGAAYLCDGDSGGAAYYVVGNMRQVIAVASALQGDRNSPDFGRSYLTALSAPEVKNFLGTWLEQKSEHVCGVGGFSHALCRTLAP